MEAAEARMVYIFMTSIIFSVMVQPCMVPFLPQSNMALEVVFLTSCWALCDLLHSTMMLFPSIP